MRWMVPGSAAGGRSPGHLHGPLLAHWLSAIATEERALLRATELEALAPVEARNIAGHLHAEREWIMEFRWPPGYDAGPGE
jgi:hypothetical protein